MNNFDWKQLLNPEFYILMEFGGIEIGLLVILFIVFAETGLFAGFFLPGDSLLFVGGIYAHEITSASGVAGPGLSYQFLNLIL